MNLQTSTTKMFHEYNGVYFSASAQLQNSIALSSACSLSETANSVYCFPKTFLLPAVFGFPPVSTKSSLVLNVHGTVFIIVARSPCLHHPCHMKYVKSSGSNKSPCLTPMVEESRRMIPSTSNRTSINLCISIARSTEISCKGTPNPKSF